MASAGGVLVSGAFQKNGGTIYGSETGLEETRKNKTSLTGNKAGAVFVTNVDGKNPAAAAKRENTTAPEITLFVDSTKSASGSAAANTIPAWATSFWDQ
jgi:hypothetical protein